MKTLSNFTLLAALFLFCQLPAHAQLRLPDIFSDNMVLQQQTNINFRGWANPTQEIRVIAGWDSSDTLETITPPDAEWSVPLTTPKAGGPYTITVMGNDTTTIQNILIGEVWLASGQSNMEMSADWHFNNYKQEIANAGHPEIRFFKIDKISAPYPQQEVRGHWVVSSPNTMRSFSGAAYFFGRRLQRNLNQPIGLIQSCWGGSPVEAWTPSEVFYEDQELAVSAAELTPIPWSPVRPGVAYNAMIHPIVNFPIAGAIWYQGEENTVNPGSYEQSFSAMIHSWRERWHHDFPFYFVQIAPFTYDEPFSASLVREAQLQTYRHIPKTGMVVTTDITGDTTNIHPKNKLDVGRRLADWALAKTYGKENIPYSGPLYKSMEVQGRKAIIHFDYTDDGLMKKGDRLRTFLIAGTDHQFVPAEAVIRGRTVVVSSPDIDQPTAVRMGFTNSAVPNLFNKDGLPASPFRTDNWPLTITDAPD